MTDYRRFFWLLTLVAFLITANGCSTSRWYPIKQELNRADSGLHQESGQSIVGYVLLDGYQAEYKGKVRLAAQDSLVFWEMQYVVENPESRTRVKTRVAGPTFSVDAVNALKIVKGNPVGTIAVAVVSVAAITWVATVLFWTNEIENSLQ